MLERKCDMCKSVIANESDNTPITLKNKQYDLCPRCVDKLVSIIANFDRPVKNNSKKEEIKRTTASNTVVSNDSIEEQVAELMKQYNEAVASEKIRRNIRLKNGKECSLDIIENYGAEKIIKSYLEGASSLYLAELVGVTKTQMDAFFKKYNIRKRTYNNSKRSNKDCNDTKEGD